MPLQRSPGALLVEGAGQSDPRGPQRGDFQQERSDGNPAQTSWRSLWGRRGFPACCPVRCAMCVRGRQHYAVGLGPKVMGPMDLSGVTNPYLHSHHSESGRCGLQVRISKTPKLRPQLPAQVGQRPKRHPVGVKRGTWRLALTHKYPPTRTRSKAQAHFYCFV